MDDIYNTDPLLKRRMMETALGTPVQSPITQPPALESTGTTGGDLQGSYNNAVQTQANILANQPHYHGWRKFFDVLGQMSPIGRGIETAAGIGTLGYQRRLGQAEQNVDRLGRQLNQHSTQHYQAPQPVQAGQTILPGQSTQLDGAQQNEDQDDNEGGQTPSDQNPINGIGLGVYDSPQNVTISSTPNSDQSLAKKKIQSPRVLWTFYS